MIERPESGQPPAAKEGVANDELFKAQEPQPGQFLKAVDEDTEVKPGEVINESDGMEKPDFLGKTDIENRGLASKEDR